MKRNFQITCSSQIESLRDDVSHLALGKKLGDIAERQLARYFAGK